VATRDRPVSWAGHRQRRGTHHLRPDQSRRREGHQRRPLPAVQVRRQRRALESCTRAQTV